MQILPELLTAFTKAIQNPENKENGSVNWNFVDADCYMDLCRSDWSAEENKDFYEQFDYLAFTYNNNRSWRNFSS
jgi:hypothetical protein